MFKKLIVSSLAAAVVPKIIRMVQQRRSRQSVSQGSLR